MVQLNGAQHISLVARACAAARGEDHGWLYKPDHERRIDAYIDFFGVGGRRQSPVEPDGSRA